MSIKNLSGFLEHMELTKQQMLIGEQILKEIRARVGFLMDVGLDYLTPVSYTQLMCIRDRG